MGSVYFLVRDRAIVYVGQSAGSPWYRVDAHRKNKRFDSAFFFPFEADDAVQAETAFIRLLSPPENRRTAPVLAFGPLPPDQFDTEVLDALGVSGSADVLAHPKLLSVCATPEETHAGVLDPVAVFTQRNDARFARKCLVPGCGRRHYGRGVCESHWVLAWQHERANGIPANRRRSPRAAKALADGRS